MRGGMLGMGGLMMGMAGMAGNKMMGFNGARGI
jgi:hypothetical protein